MVLFFMVLKRIQLPTFSNDLFARDQNHEKKHHLPLSIASVFQVSCSMPYLSKKNWKQLRKDFLLPIKKTMRKRIDIIPNFKTPNYTLKI